MTSKIGDTVYTFDVNRRVYARDEQGKPHGGPIYREHWRPWLIVGEEKRSWIVAYPDGTYPRKVSKTSFKTETEVADACWLEVTRYRFSEAVRKCNNVDLLRRAAAVIGFEA